MTALILGVLLGPLSADAQRDSTFDERAGFEGAHAAFATAFFTNSARFNLDISFTRADGSFLGLRGMLATDDAAHVHSTPPRQYAFGALALLGIRTMNTQFDLAVGPARFLESRKYRADWRLYLSGDLRVPIYREYLFFLAHASFETVGIGASIGYMRD